MTRPQKENSSLKIFERLKTFFFFQLPRTTLPSANLMSSQPRSGWGWQNPHPTMRSSSYPKTLILLGESSKYEERRLIWIWGWGHLLSDWGRPPWGWAHTLMTCFAKGLHFVQRCLCHTAIGQWLPFLFWEQYKPKASYRFWKVRAKPWKPTWIPAK